MTDQSKVSVSRELLEECRDWVANDGYGNVGRRALVARLSAALAQPAPAQADGWIEHDGSGLPVDGRSLVEIKRRNGSIGAAFNALALFGWLHDNSQYDIIAYRIAEGANETAAQQAPSGNPVRITANVAPAAAAAPNAQEPEAKAAENQQLRDAITVWQQANDIKRDNYDKLEAELAALKSKLAELEADAERLDWLWRKLASQEFFRLVGNNAREAIDAARRAGEAG